MPAIDTMLVRSLLGRLALPADELAEQARRADDPAYWLGLNPDLTIGSDDDCRWMADEPADDEKLDLAVVQYRRDGHSSVGRALSGGHADRMRRCIETLRKHDWPPVFAFVYDAFWQIGRSAMVNRLLRSLLDAEPVLLPRVWCHYVAPTSGNAGWRPHIDGRPGTARTISLWIPLSEATVSNGCMYVVARDEFTAALGDTFSSKEITYGADQVKAMLGATRALPAVPGQVLFWDERIIHWGSAYSAGGPRVSLALEFTTEAFVPPEGELASVPMNGAAPLPDFAFRLHAIGRALLNYRRFEPFLERFAPLAHRLMHGAGADSL